MRKTKLTSEEEFLLQNFSRQVSTKSSALFYGNAFIVSSLPIWLYWRIQETAVDKYSITLSIIGTAIAAFLISFAYVNTKHLFKHKFAVKREEEVARQLTKQFANDKKMAKKDKDERILWKQNDVADYEATTFSIFYNNSIFLFIVIVLTFWIFKSFNPLLGYSLTMLLSAGLVALFSTGTK